MDFSLWTCGISVAFDAWESAYYLFLAGNPQELSVNPLMRKIVIFLQETTSLLQWWSSTLRIEVESIGFVRRASSNEKVRDKSLVSRLVLKKDLTRALDGVEEFSHVFIIYWMHKISSTERKLVHTSSGAETPPLGVFACRGPIRPNPIGLTVVELVKREENVLWLRGLDALDGTPVLDIKPYGRPSDTVVDFRAPKRFYRD